VFSLFSDYLPSIAKFNFSLLGNLILRAHRKLNMSSISSIFTDSKQTPFLKVDPFFPHCTSELAVRETNTKQTKTFFFQTFEQVKTHPKLSLQ